MSSPITFPGGIVSPTATITTLTAPHSSLTGLASGDDHTQYTLLAGRSGGQILTGGTASGNSLTLRSTSNASKGSVIIDETTVSSNSSTGCLVLGGGLGVAGALNVDGATIFNNNTNVINTILYINGSITGSPDAFGKFFKVDTVSFTDSATASSGTASSLSFSAFRKPTLHASNTSVTTTNASTLYIQDSPGNGTNMTITNPWAFFVNAGKSKFQGAVVISDSTVSTTAGTGCLTLSGGLGLLGAINAGSSISGTTLISTVSTGTAPLTVSSTTNVANLNASLLNGNTFASPGSIGNTTPGSGAFTTLTSSGLTTFTNSTNSTASSNGSVVLSGGLGVALDFYLGGNLNVTGTTIFNNNTNVINTILYINGSITGSPDAFGKFFKVDTVSFTDSATASSGTASSMSFNAFRKPTLNASNTSVTTTNASTVYIQDAPGAGTNQTLTNAWAFFVNAGKSKFQGAIVISDSTASTNSSTGCLTLSGGLGLLGAINAGGNISGNNLVPSYTTIVTAAGTTTLTNSSTQLQYFTGSTTQTVVLPVTSTLSQGYSFTIVNNSSGVVTVQSSGLNTIQAMAANTTLIVTCILTSGTSASSWSSRYMINGLTTFSGDGSLITNSSSTGAITVTLGSQSANTVFASPNGSSGTPSFRTLVGADLGNSLTLTSTLSASTLTSTVSTGTAPLTVSSTTVVSNLNASLLNGNTFANPGAIGSTTPATTIAASGIVTLSNTTVSSNSSTGALVVSGGVGIAGALNVDGASIFNSNTNIINAILYINGSITGSPDAFGKFFKTDTVSFTDSSTASSGTAASMSFHAFRKPTLNASNTSVTTTNASTVYIQDAPGAGTNQTLTNAWAFFVNAGKSKFQGAVTISDSTSSTTTGTGCLILSGGLGLLGAINAGGNISGNTLISTVSTGTAPLTVSSTTVVSNLNASLLNGNTFANPGAIGSGTAATTIAASGVVTFSNSTASTNSSTGALVLSAGGLAIGNTTDASSSTNGGSFTTAGGFACAKQGFFGTSVTASTLISTVSTGTAPLTVSSTTVVSNLNASLLNGNTFANPGAIGSGTAATTIAASGIVTFSNSTVSTSNSTGALVLSAGGLGINNTTDSTSITNGGSLTSSGGFAFAKQGYIGVGLSVGNSSTATSPTNTGVLTVFGNTTGAPSVNGVSMRVTSQTFNDSSTSASGTAASDVVFNKFDSPTLTATNASVTTTNAHNMFINGAAAAGSNQTITNSYGLTLDGNSVNLKGGSLLNMQGTLSYTPGTNGSGFKIGAMTFIDTATASSGTVANVFVNAIGAPVLRASNTSVTTSNAYSLVISAPTAGTNNTITNAYALGTIGGIFCNGTLTIPTGAQVAVTGSSTTTGINFSGNYMMYKTAGVSVRLVPAASGSNWSWRNTSDNADIVSIGATGITTISDSTASTSSSTGALVLNAGGLAIANTTDASSSTNGGGASIAGGLAVAKKCYVGTSLIVNSTTMLPVTKTSASLSNNQATPANITGMVIADTTNDNAYVFNMYVNLTATSSGYHVRQVIVYKTGSSSSWAIADNSLAANGAAYPLTLSVTTAGQVQYTSVNTSGFTSLTVSFQARIGL